MSKAEAAAQVFAALGDPTRLSLVGKLSGGEAQSIARLSEGTRISRQAVTKHLAVLEAAGLVSRLRRGRESRYAYRPDPVAEARAYLDEVSAQWDAAIGRLQAFVENETSSPVGRGGGPFASANGGGEGVGTSPDKSLRPHPPVLRPGPSLSPRERGEATALARRLRRDQTEVERRMWAILRSRQLDGFKFRRQVPIGRYVADFACIEARLVVELDGSQHAERQDYDAARTAAIEAAGFKVMRFWNADVTESPENVAETILAELRLARR
jgi:very-short-patch-repair endonuclease/DNA-binding transcriptional ArsR family regulator